MFQDGLPIRLKGIHVFNAVPLIHQLLALVKPIMKKELFDLVYNIKTQLNFPIQ